MLEMCVILEVMGRAAQHATPLHYWSRGQNNEQQNNAPIANPKKQCSCRLSGSTENKALKGTGLLKVIPDFQTPKIGLKK